MLALGHHQPEHGSGKQHGGGEEEGISDGWTVHVRQHSNSRARAHTVEMKIERSRHGERANRQVR